MTDILRLYVLWSEHSRAGACAAEAISAHFDGLGMERDGVSHRVPVRFRTISWEASGAPLRIDLDAAEHNAIVLLHDDRMADDQAMWDAYVEELRARMDGRGGRDLYLPFGSPSGDPPLPSDARRHTQYARRDRWPAPGAGALAGQGAHGRLLLHMLHALRAHIRALHGPPGREMLFVSHAKADGDETARAIVDHVNATGQDVPLETFYDAKELSPGSDYERRFAEEISQGTLLAIVSDVYDSRPWCVFELTTAKRARRPIVLADVGRVRTSRTFPYGANLPRVRVNTAIPGDSDWIEPLLIEALSEGLRCDLFKLQAELTLAGKKDGAMILPRPPELFDLIQATDLADCVIYPDPPLDRLEEALLQDALAKMGQRVTIRSLGEAV